VGRKPSSAPHSRRARGRGLTRVAWTSPPLTRASGATRESRGPSRTMNHLPTVVGLGEILWDLLPSGRQLGGAPANFAYCSHLLGDRGIVASRVGGDQLGIDIRESLAKAGISDQFLQTDATQPTGTVRVQLDPAGQPKFEITQ